MQDFLLEPEGFAAVMDRIVDFECDLMRLAARHGFHGIHFADDWGTQSGLMISPAMCATCQAPYARQFAVAHDVGLHVWYHCCGEFLPIMEDFREIGVDVLNISQPNVNDIAEVGRRFRGRQCFMVPIGYSDGLDPRHARGDPCRGPTAVRQPAVSQAVSSAMSRNTG